MQELGWRVIEASVQGYSHERLNKPNQDRILFFQDQDNGLPIVLAISDGHGGSGYYRSERGAQFAVESAIEMCKLFLATNQNLLIGENFSQKRLKETLCRSIVDEWNKRVKKDIQEKPIPNEDSSDKTDILKSKRPIEQNISTPYGATLLTVIVTNSELIFLQLGDGDILIIADNGDSIRPLPRDPRLIGNETTSLCTREAWDDFITGSISINDVSPALIMVSTDGYANSYPDEESFQKVGQDILNLICCNEAGIDAGIDNIESNFKDWLNETSEKGSGDDITVGIMSHKETILHFLDKNKKLLCSKELN